MKSFSKVKHELLKDKSVREAYDALGPEFELIAVIIERRRILGITQAELARKIGTKQSAIARLESGTYNPTVSFLSKVAKALDTRLAISFS